MVRAERRWTTAAFDVAVLVLASAWPFLSFVDANRGEIIDVPRIVFAFVLTTVAAALVFGGVWAILRPVDSRPLALSVGAGVVCFFSFDWLFGRRQSAPAVEVGLWLLVTALAVVVVHRFTRSANARTFALVFLAVLVLVPAVALVLEGLDTGQSVVAAESAPLPGVELAAGEPHPNVYWFVFDEYGRADQLDAVFGYDNHAMVDALEERGFIVSDDRYTSYPVTHLSLASVLSMDYVATTEADLEAGPYAWSTPLRGPSAVVDTFHALGYDHIYAEAGLFAWNRCDADYTEVCLGAEHQGWTLDELELALIDLTPLGALDLAREGYIDPVSVVEEAQDHGDASGRPFFVSAHILSPHHPYWFRDDCTRRDVPIRGLDADRHLHELRCLNEAMQRAVDLIIERDPDALVILQSDTGSRILTDWHQPLDGWSREALDERYAVFEAMRLPEGCDLPEGPISTVNTFRIVFACMTDSEPAVLDYRAFMWRDTAPDEIVEIAEPPGTAVAGTP